MSGCGHEPRLIAVKVDTTPSGVVHVLNPLEGRWGSATPWVPRSQAVVGGADARGPEAFGRIAGIAIGIDGTVYVLDQMSSEVRVFDSRGRWLRTLGRSGHGPGEFSLAAGLLFDGDERLWVLDGGNQRYTLYDTAGSFVRQFPRPMAETSLEWREGVFTPTGDLFDVITYRNAQGWQTRVARYDTASASFVDTAQIPELPSRTPFRWGFMSPSAAGWWYGVADRYKVWEMARTGDTLRVLTRALEAARLSRSARDSLDVERERIESRSQRSVDLTPPSTVRLFRALIPDDRGYLWILLDGDEEARSTFDVFDPEGIYLGSLTFPVIVEGSPLPKVRGRWMALIATDSLDVQSVHVYELEGR